MARGSTFQAPIRIKDSTGALVTVIDDDGNIDAPVTTTNLTTTGTTTLGDTNDATQINGPTTVGVDDTGYDVQLFGATAGAHLLWDESADTLKLVGGAKTNLQGTLTVGVDDTGYDVQLFGATASAHLLWDESADTLKLVGGAKIDAQGTVTVGVNDTGYDVKFFGATAGKSLLWDESADELIVTGEATVVSADASALAVGLNGATNPALVVDASTASSATGLKVKSAAAAGGVAVSVVSSGTDEAVTIDAKGTGTLTLNGTATGNIVLGAAATGVSTSLTGGDTLKNATAVPATAGAVAAGVPLSMYSTGITIEVTSDAPTHTRPKGSICINTGGSSTSTRMYVNTDGAGTWASFTTSA